MIDAPICKGCGLNPQELDEYIVAGAEENMSAVDYVLNFEGTLNPENNHFLCTPCYIDAGMPSSANGWICP